MWLKCAGQVVKPPPIRELQNEWQKDGTNGQRRGTVEPAVKMHVRLK
jgi:hypothetical protein